MTTLRATITPVGSSGMSAPPSSPGMKVPLEMRQVCARNTSGSSQLRVIVARIRSSEIDMPVVSDELAFVSLLYSAEPETRHRPQFADTPPPPPTADEVDCLTTSSCVNVNLVQPSSPMNHE